MNPLPATCPPNDEPPAEQVEDALDEGLAESFPASDPVAIAVDHPEKAREGP